MLQGVFLPRVQENAHEARTRVYRQVPRVCPGFLLLRPWRCFSGQTRHVWVRPPPPREYLREWSPPGNESAGLRADSERAEAEVTHRSEGAAPVARLSLLAQSNSKNLTELGGNWRASGPIRAQLPTDAKPMVVLASPDQRLLQGVAG